MVYKKYIKKNGKTYGPYVYHSERVGGKVVNTYYGHHKKKNLKKLLSFILIAFLLLFFIVLFSFNQDGVSNFFGLTGQAVSDIDAEFVMGQPLQGTLTFSLREGELLPASSKLGFENSGNRYEFSLGEVTNSRVVEGKHYIEGFNLESYGTGYGKRGVKEFHPEVFFEIEIYTEAERQRPGVAEEGVSKEAKNKSGFVPPGQNKTEGNESSNETVAEEVNATINETEKNETVAQEANVTINKTAEENILGNESDEGAMGVNGTKEDAVNDESPEDVVDDNQEEQVNGGVIENEPLEKVPKDEGAEDEPLEKVPETEENIDETETIEETSGSGITGNVVLGFLGLVYDNIFSLTGQSVIDIERTVEGNVSFDEPFTLDIEEGEKARIKKASVETSLGSISDGDVRLEIVNRTVVVTTNYIEEDSGFGKDYLRQDGAYEINVDLLGLDLILDEGPLEIYVEHGGQKLISLSTELKEGENVEVNQTFMEPNVTEAFNATLQPKVNITITQIENIPDITIIKNGNYSLDLSNYFEPSLGIGFSIGEVSNLSMDVSGNIVNIVPETDFVGTTSLKVFASLGNYSLESNLFNVIVSKGNVSVETVQLGAVLGQPVKWRKNVNKGISENVTVQLPKIAQNIAVKRIKEDGTREDVSSNIGNKSLESAETGIAEESLGNEITGNFILSFFSLISENILSLTGQVVEEIPNNLNTGEVIDVEITDNATDYEIEYETPPPVSFEEPLNNGKRITVSGPNEVHYKNVLAFLQLGNEVPENRVKVYHLVPETIVDEITNETQTSLNKVLVNFTSQDSNGNGLIDYVEWIVPRLSNQTYEIIIEITKAEHLNESRNFVEDIYDLVREKDGIWTQTIPQNHYVRVVFEKPLDKNKDITLFARNLNSSEPGIVEVYTENGNQTIATFDNISEEAWYKVYLTGLNEGKSYSTFDLQVKNPGGVEFDYIVDPVPGLTVTLNASDDPTNTTNANLTAFTDQDSNTSLKIVHNFYKNNVSRTIVNFPFEADNLTDAKDFANGHDGKVLGGVQFLSNIDVDGFGGYNFTGVDDRINFNDTTLWDGFVDNGTWSAEIWYYPMSNSSNYVLLDMGNVHTSTNGRNGFRINSIGTAGASINIQTGTNGSSKNFVTTNIIQERAWNHVVAVYNGSNLSLYLDGVIKNSSNRGWKKPTPSITYATIGAGASSTEAIGQNNLSFNGTMGRARLWNITLTKQDVEILYKNETNLILSSETSEGDNWHVQAWASNGSDLGNPSNSTALEILAPPPTTVIVYPENTTYGINVTNLNYTYTDVNFCWYSTNGGTTNSSIVSCGTNFTNVISTEGSNTWTVYANNSDNVLNFSRVTFLKDLSPPFFTNITNVSIFTNQSASIDINASDTLSSISCFTVNDTTNFQINCSGALSNITGLSAAIYWINITINDSGNNLNSSIMHVNVSNLPKTSPINLTFVAPTPANEINSSNQTYTFNVSVVTELIKELNFTINSSTQNFYNGSLALFVNLDNSSAFDENLTRYVDHSLNSNNGTCRLSGFDECPAFSSGGGQYGLGGADFENNGSSDYIDFGSDAIFDLGNEFTVMGWVKPESLPDNPKIFIKSNFGVTARSWTFGANSLGQLRATNGSNSGVNNDVATLTAGTWTHIAFVHNGTSVIYYADGSRKGDPDRFYYTDVASHNFYIGGGGDGTDANNFDGIADEVKLFDYQLTDEEINREYRNQFTRNNASDWIFTINDENLATTTNDKWTYEFCGANSTSTKCIERNITVDVCVFDTNFSITSNYNCEVINITGGSYLQVYNSAHINASQIFVENGSQIFGSTINISVKNLTVSADSFINSSIQGHSGGNVGSSGFGPGGGNYSLSSDGGGYGGKGGKVTLLGNGSLPYGSALKPYDLGSGGAGGSDWFGGSGGGRIRIHVFETFNLNGGVLADGDDGSGGPGGAFIKPSGGSGGSIWIDTYNLAGSGNFSANGGDNQPLGLSTTGHGGSGGRIAVYYNITDWGPSDFDRSSVENGGTSASVLSEYGTLIFIDLDDSNGFIVDGFRFQGNSGRNKETYNLTTIHNSSHPGVFNFNNLTIYNAVNVTGNVSTLSINVSEIINITNSEWNNNLDSTEINLNATKLFFHNSSIVENSVYLYVDNVSLFDNGDLITTSNLEFNQLNSSLHIVGGSNLLTGDFVFDFMDWRGKELNLSGGSMLEGEMNFSIGNLTLDVSSLINGSGRGYSGGGLNSNGNGPGGGTYDGAFGSTGGSYGGYSNTVILTHGKPYGSALKPYDLGSGGAGGSDGFGGSGGGRIRIKVNDLLELNGIIVSDGEAALGGDPGSFVGPAGGSGGSIWIDTYNLTGSGNFSSKGGRGGAGSVDRPKGAGSGGRIAVYYNITDWGPGNFDNSDVSGGSTGGFTGGNGTLIFIDFDDNSGFITKSFRFQGDNETVNVSTIHNSSFPGVFNFNNLTIYGAVNVTANITPLTINVTDTLNFTDVEWGWDDSQPQIKFTYGRDFVGKDQDFENTFELIVEKQGVGKVEWIPTLTNVSNISTYFNISLNKTFLNSTALSGLNKSANLTFFNQPSLINNPIYDPENDGTFAVCPSTICVELFDIGGTFIYNVTHFTAFGATNGSGATIIYPENTTYSVNVTNLNYTYASVNFCWYSTDNGTTNSSTVVCGNNFTDVISTEGSNNWTLYSNDTSNTLFVSSVTFTKDTNPNATLISPENGTVTSTTQQNFTANISDNTGLQNATLFIYNATGLFFNETVTFAAGLTNTLVGIVTTLTDGVYNWFYQVFDIGGNVFVTENRTITIDTIPPAFTDINNISIFTNQSASIDINATDATTSVSCFAVNDTTNFQINCSGALSNITALSAKLYVLNITVNDSANNLNSSLMNVNVTSAGINVGINLTSPLQDSEIVRGSNAVTGEDDLGAIPDKINITAKVYNTADLSGIANETCFFYDNGALLGNSTSNTTGECIFNYNKTAATVGIRELLVNYTLSSGTKSINDSQVNATMAQYKTLLTMSNLRPTGDYYDGDEAVILMNFTKSNGTLNSTPYDPPNITATALDSADSIRGIKYYTGDIMRHEAGNYSTNITVNYSDGAGSFIKWNVNSSDDNYTSYLSTAVHADETVCSADFGDWSEFSECFEGQQTRTRSDSSGCTEVETQSCGSGGGGGGGGGGTGGTCTDECSSEGDIQNTCSDIVTLATRTCGNFDSDSCLEYSGWIYISCDTGEVCDDIAVECVPESPTICTPDWQCTDWGQCFLGEYDSGNGGGGTGTGNVIQGYDESNGIFTLTGNSVADNLRITGYGIFDKFTDFFNKLVGKDKDKVPPGQNKTEEPPGQNKTQGNKSFNDTIIVEPQSNETGNYTGNYTEGNETYVNETETNQTLESPPDSGDGGRSSGSDGSTSLGENEYLVQFNERRTIIVNQGDRISVTYVEKVGSRYLLKVIVVPTADSTLITETHQFYISGIAGENIIVTVESHAVSQELAPGETSIFDIFEDVFLSPAMIQTRTCTDVNDCGTDFGKPEETRLCLECNPDWECGSWFGPIYGTQERVCTDLNGCESDRIETREVACIESWTCSWTQCREDSEGDYYVNPYNCVDLNGCGTENGRPVPSSCFFNETTQEYEPETEECLAEWQFGEWGHCRVKYTLREVIQGKFIFDGTRERNLTDISSCNYRDRIQVEVCDPGLPITAERSQWCFEEYIRIYDANTGDLVSIMKAVIFDAVSSLNKVDVHFVTEDTSGTCAYCFDGVKNFDETDVDCGGISCPACVYRGTFFDWLFWLIIILWVLVAIIALITYREARKKGVVRFKFRRVFGRIKNFFGKAKLKEPEKEKIIEKKIALGFKKLFKWPFKPFKFSFKRRRKHLAEKMEIRERKVVEKKVVERRPVGKALVVERIIERVIIRKPKEKVEVREKKPKKIYGRKVIVKKPRRKENIFLAMIRRLRKQRREGYYGTVHVEKHVKEGQRELKEIKKEKEVIEEARKVKKKRGRFLSRLGRLKRKGYYGTSSVEKELRKHEKKREKEVRKLHKLVEKKVKKRERHEKREKKRKIKKLKKEVRGRKLKSLMKKLRLYKKEGYYGTAELEREIKRLKGK